MEPIDPTALPVGADVGAFFEVQREAGASFYRSSSGRLWTKAFVSADAEYRAVRRDAGVWDVSSLAKYRFVGRDALPALDRLTTRAMVTARPGTVRYAIMLDEGGNLLDEGTVVVASTHEVYYLGNDGDDGFLGHLVEHTTDLDVLVENLTGSISNVSVQGPRSLQVLAGLTSSDISSLRWFSVAPEPVEVAGVRGMLVRAGYTGERGYEFYLLDGDAGAEGLWDAVIEAGATPVGFDAIDMLRVEAGLVMRRREYEPGATNPYDLSFDRFIELDHGFVGRAACLEQRDAATRRLVTLTLEGGDIAVRGSDVLDGVEPVGMLTSVVTTPAYGSIALGVVAAGRTAEGTSLVVDGGSAIIRSHPIYDPTKERQRG